MVKAVEFKAWLKEKTDYSDAVVGDMASRVKRADHILEWNGQETYQFYLEQKPEYRQLSVSVRSQIKRAVKLYTDFYADSVESTN